MLFFSLKYCVMVAVLKSVLMYDGNMHYANLPHCVTNLHNYLLWGISIFPFLFLILASFKCAFILLLRFEYTTYRNYKDKSGGNISLHIWLIQICDILPLVVTKRLFCKGESEVTRFFFLKLSSKPNFESVKIFDPNLVTVTWAKLTQ